MKSVPMEDADILDFREQCQINSEICLRCLENVDDVDINIL
jgi:hypothetical protein